MLANLSTLLFWIAAVAALGTAPSFGADPSWATHGCSNVRRSIVPIKIARSDAASPYASRYFSYRGRTLALVGVSADNGCHLEGLPANQCNADNFRRTLNAAAKAGLNKIRLWVVLAGERRAANVPFAFDGSYWRLDQKNQAYFDSLRRVVAYAQSRNLFVEVTLFAPFEGDHFTAGPWDGRGRLPNAQGELTTVRFSSPRDFVEHGRREDVSSDRMQAAQKRVIDWTIDELWCFDNVIWEIANEPEHPDADPREVAAWQRERIRDVRAAEARYPSAKGGVNGSLDGGGHLIAVQPFTNMGALEFLDDPEVDLLNGHYATVRRSGRPTRVGGSPSGLNLGALSLIQRYGDRTKLFGWNETKITPLGGKAGTRAHRNGVLVEGLPDPARAEAWEFLFSQGAAYDHFGYLAGGNASAASTPRQIRRQLGVLAKFINGLPLARLRSTRAPAWITLDPYPREGSIEGLDPTRVSHRYWAALETPLDAPNRRFLLYIHHSTIRCAAHAGDNAPEVDFGANGCPNPLGFNAYDARLWPARPYQAQLRLRDLGPSPGTFEVRWVDPKSGRVAASSKLRWDPKTERCNGGKCEITSPPYEFDIALQIEERPLTNPAETRRRFFRPRPNS